MLAVGSLLALPHAVGTGLPELRDAAVGVVNEEVELRVEFGFCSNRDWPAPTDSINVVDNSHYITSPFPIGWLPVSGRGASPSPEAFIQPASVFHST